MEKFCEVIRQYTRKIINYEKANEMIPLTNEENEYHEM